MIDVQFIYWYCCDMLPCCQEIRLGYSGRIRKLWKMYRWLLQSCRKHSWQDRNNFFLFKSFFFYFLDVVAFFETIMGCSSGKLIWNCSNTTKYVTIVVNNPLNRFRLTSKKPPQFILLGFISVARKNILISVCASEFIQLSSTINSFFWKLVRTNCDALCASSQM